MWHVRFEWLSRRLRPRSARRGPVMLPLVPLAVLLLGIGGFAGHNLIVGSNGALEPDTLVRWVLLTWLGTGLAALPTFFWALLSRRGLARPGRANWLLFYGLFGASSLFGGVVRSLLADWALGSALDDARFWGLALNLAFSSLAVIVALEVFASRAQRLRDWQHTLARLESELAQSRAEVVAADDRLRKEMTELLHGDVESRLVSAWSRLDQARDLWSSDPAMARDRLQESLGHLNDLADHGMARARDMLAVPSTGSSFRGSLEDLVRRFQAILPAGLLVDGGFVDVEVAPIVQHTCLRMVEEALLNAFRHSEAEQVVVRLTANEAEGLKIEVRDDGVGFDLGAVRRGLGLSGFGGTLFDHGGCWSVQSSPGDGTVMSLRVPLIRDIRAVLR